MEVLQLQQCCAEMRVRDVNWQGSQQDYSISKIDSLYVYILLYCDLLHPSESLILHISIIKYLEIQQEKIKRSTVKVLLLSSPIYTEPGLGIVCISFIIQKQNQYFHVSLSNTASVIHFSGDIKRKTLLLH